MKENRETEREREGTNYAEGMRVIKGEREVGQREREDEREREKEREGEAKRKTRWRKGLLREGERCTERQGAFNDSERDRERKTKSFGFLSLDGLFTQFTFRAETSIVKCFIQLMTQAFHPGDALFAQGSIYTGRRVAPRKRAILQTHCGEWEY